MAKERRTSAGEREAVVNVSGEDRELTTLGVVVTAGETVEVDAEVAGRAPSGTPGEDGYDPGEGLLAQPDNWQRAGGRPAEEKGDS